MWITSREAVWWFTSLMRWSSVLALPLSWWVGSIGEVNHGAGWRVLARSEGAARADGGWACRRRVGVTLQTVPHNEFVGRRRRRYCCRTGRRAAGLSGSGSLDSEEIAWSGCGTVRLRHRSPMSRKRVRGHGRKELAGRRSGPGSGVEGHEGGADPETEGASGGVAPDRGEPVEVSPLRRGVPGLRHAPAIVGAVVVDDEVDIEAGGDAGGEERTRGRAPA